MKSSIKIGTGSLRTSRLIITIPFADTAAPSDEYKNFHKYLPKRILLGLSDSVLFKADFW